MNFLEDIFYKDRVEEVREMKEAQKYGNEKPVDMKIIWFSVKITWCY